MAAAAAECCGSPALTKTGGDGCDGFGWAAATVFFSGPASSKNPTPKKAPMVRLATSPTSARWNRAPAENRGAAGERRLPGAANPGESAGDGSSAAVSSVAVSSGAVSESGPGSGIAGSSEG
ncbi:MAG TPA: hypothetical protein VGM07_07150 [Stellaceae bacterium]